jgi:DNA-binding transcriptional MerR regulator
MESTLVARAGIDPGDGVASSTVEPDGALTIDELAAKTGVPSRTIRFYQAKGALRPPERRGRVAYYLPAHEERLRLVLELQERGLHLKAIRDLLARADAGAVSLSDWLGIGDRLRAPWSDDRPRMLAEDELVALLDGKRGLVAELVRARLVRREGGGVPPSYVVSSPGLLQVALRLHEAGLTVDLASEITEILREGTRRAADDLVHRLAKAARRRESGDLAASIDAFRGVALEAVKLVFAQEMERALRRAVESGRVLRDQRRAARRAVREP